MYFSYFVDSRIIQGMIPSMVVNAGSRRPYHVAFLNIYFSISSKHFQKNNNPYQCGFKIDCPLYCDSLNTLMCLL